MKIVGIFEKIVEMHRFEITKKTFAKNCIYSIIQLKRGKKSILWVRIKDIGGKLLKANLKLIILQSNKLESIKNMNQNLLKMKNLCKLMNALQCL